MEISHHQLKETYEDLSTDELLHINASSELTEMAALLLKDELKKRNISSEDYNIANRDAQYIKAERDNQKKSMVRRIQIHFIFLAILLTIGIYYSYFK